MAQLQPRKSKFKKTFKGNNRGNASSCRELIFGQYGIQVLENKNLKANTFEATLKIMNKRVKSSGRVWSRIFPHKPITKKPIETRMGKGKGAIDHYVAVIRPGNVILEFDGVTFLDAQKVLSECMNKLGVSCRLLQRDTGNILI